jgi:hypothetical protein
MCRGCREVVKSVWQVVRPWMGQFCILYSSSNSCSTCFGQPRAHHQELKTTWWYSLVLVCAVAAGRLWSPCGRWCIRGCVRSTTGPEGQVWYEPIHGRTTFQPDLTTFPQPRHIPTQGYNITQSWAPDDGHMVARNILSNYQKRNKKYKKGHLVGFSYPHWITMHGQPHIWKYYYSFLAMKRI